MKFTIQRETLVSLIGKIQGVVPSKAVIPILSNILIEARGREVVIMATDLTVSMRVHADAQIESEGAVTLPAKKFFQLIRELTTPEVCVETNDNGMAIVTAGTSHFRMNGMDREEFPSFPDLSDGRAFSISTLFFKEMLVNTSFAAARDDSRQVLNGVLLELEDGQATVVGTDGKRLAKVCKFIDYTDPEKQASIIPLKAVEEMVKVLEGEQSVSVTIMADKIALESGKVSIVSKLLSGQFPDYERVIPDESSMQKITIHREELMTLLRQVSLFTSDTSHSVKLTFDSGELRLQAQNSDIGEGKVNMPVDYRGEMLEIAFNPQYFLDILRHCHDETVEFGVSDSFNPGSITDSSDAHFVLMPMRLTADVC